MDRDPRSIPMACWLGESAGGMLEGLARRSDLRIVAIGGDGPVARTAAEAAGHALLDDPRQLAAVPEASVILLMDPERPFDPEVLSAIVTAASARPVLSLTPRPGGLAAFLDEQSPLSSARALPLPVPCFRGTRRGRRLIEAAETFGTPNSAMVEVGGPAVGGVLATRLVDAVDLLSIWFGLPSLVQATAVQPIGGDSAVRRLFVNARYPDGRAAAIAVGADGGRHQRSVVLLGAAGRLRCVDGAIDWSDPDGVAVEFEAPPAATADDFAVELAESIEAAVAGRLPIRGAAATLDLMAVGEACLLSARTGEPESIENVRRILGRV